MAKGTYMTSTTVQDQQKLFGLFELDAAGNVLYARIEPDGDNKGKAEEVAGHNFFERVAPFKNAEELRRRISVFAHGRGQADSFHFTCDFGNGPLLVKVLLARISEQSNEGHTKSILLHIRKV
jgi:hypothetical protein